MLNKKLFLKRSKIIIPEFLYIYNNDTTYSKSISYYTDNIVQVNTYVSASSYLTVALNRNDKFIYFPGYGFYQNVGDGAFRPVLSLISGAKIIEHGNVSDSSSKAIIEITDSIVEIELSGCVGSFCHSGGSS